MHGEDKIQELLIGQAKIFAQLDRIISDSESEKEVRKRHNEEMNRRIRAMEDEMNNRIRALEDYKSNVQGRIAVTLVVGGSIWGLIIILITFLIKNKT